MNQGFLDHGTLILLMRNKWPDIDFDNMTMPEFYDQYTDFMVIEEYEKNKLSDAFSRGFGGNGEN